MVAIRARLHSALDLVCANRCDDEWAFGIKATRHDAPFVLVFIYLREYALFISMCNIYINNIIYPLYYQCRIYADTITTLKFICVRVINLYMNMVICFTSAFI